MDKSPLLIGVDGGASKVSAWKIIYNRQDETFSLGNANSTKAYREIIGYVPNYKPVELNVQLSERNAEIMPGSDEKQQAGVYVEACAQAVFDLTEKTGNKNVLIGIGMPGLKTADKRGIEVVANGPRMVNYAENLESRLKELGVNLASKIDHLGSDADYCGIGENYSAEGLFRTASNAYYLGGGTGVADAMKIEGELITFDEAKPWIAKTWEMKSENGVSLELLTSVSGIQKTYAGFANVSIEELNKQGLFPLQMAERAYKGEQAALYTFKVVNDNLAKLLYERLVTLNQGWKNLFDFVNPNRPKPDAKHKFCGKVFDLLIIGQRLGDLFEDQYGSEVVRKPVLQMLDELIQKSPYLTNEVKKHYQNLNQIVKISKLREAPALGAGVDAFLSKTENEL